MDIIQNAIQEMEKNGIHQWDDIYPNRNVILDDINEGSLYSVVSDNRLVAIVTLNEKSDREYQNIDWVDNGRSLIVHRLCVNPQFQGRGIAKYLMRFAEDFAKEKGYSSIRLDAFINNPQAVGLYSSLEYEKRGTVTFRKGEFFCFEKQLKG